MVPTPRATSARLAAFLLLSAWALAVDFPKVAGYVTDAAGLLDPVSEASLNGNLREFERNTTAQIFVVTVDSLGGLSIEEYAVSLFEQAKPGQKGIDNGVLLLVSKEDRKARIEVGYGLEGVINDARAGDIIRNDITPAFRVGDYAGGITLAVYDLERLVRQEPTSTDLREKARENIIPILLVVFIVMLALFIFLVAPPGRGGYSPRRPGARGGFGGGFGGGGGGGFGGGGGGKSGGGGASGGW